MDSRLHQQICKQSSELFASEQFVHMEDLVKAGRYPQQSQRSFGEETQFGKDFLKKLNQNFNPSDQGSTADRPFAGMNTSLDPAYEYSKGDLMRNFNYSGKNQSANISTLKISSIFKGKEMASARHSDTGFGTCHELNGSKQRSFNLSKTEPFGVTKGLKPLGLDPGFSRTKFQSEGAPGKSAFQARREQPLQNLSGLESSGSHALMMSRSSRPSSKNAVHSR